MDNNWIIHLMENILALGVKEFCLCTGKRNAMLVSLLDSIPQVRKYPFFDERAAAFFALGRARVTGCPVGVCTTSGTACGELLPAAMEAYYSGVPLLLLTADRPKRYRGTGAPQSAEQQNIFGPYTPHAYDIFEGEKIPRIHWCKKQPLHLNVCLEEPPNQISAPDHQFIVQKNVTHEDPIEPNKCSLLQNFLNHVSTPIVIVSTLSEKYRASVKEFLLHWKVPVYLEAVSGLRSDPDLDSQSIRDLDVFLKQGYPLGGILRIGGVPTHRLWRDLEDTYKYVDVLSLSEVPFSGIPNGTVIHGAIDSYLEHIEVDSRKGLYRELWDGQKRWEEDVKQILQKEPSSEQAMLHHLSKIIPSAGRVFLGNSLPIREWDRYSCIKTSPNDVWASRGVNGIDGQLSTFLGLCSMQKENWAILGDLTTLYDIAAPWIVPFLEQASIQIVVVNNGGGMIFSRLKMGEHFYNRHTLRFENFAKMWGLEYSMFKMIPPLLPRRYHQVIELSPDEEASNRVDQEIKHIMYSYAKV